MADLHGPLRLTPQTNCLSPPPGARSLFDFLVPGAHAPGYAYAAAPRLNKHDQRVDCQPRFDGRPNQTLEVERN